MKTSKYYISTLREAPSEAVIASHKLMLRAGITRKLGNGLYTYLPLGVRSLYKLENIIREELESTANALEFKPTVIVPGDLWKESGRWETMGPQMLKAKNRGEQDMVVSPTAEEAYTAIVRDGLDSYKQLPVNLYQINTKYRDEIRPRYGVMRGREFIMMDGYTMNADDASLDECYNDYEKAYFRIFKRLGLKIIPVRADSGAMGGSGSEEFMVESPIGDDTLIICPNGDYAANVEKAACKADESVNKKGEKVAKTDKEIEMVATPNVFSIEDMENRPRETYRFVMITEGDEEKKSMKKLNTSMEAYMLLGQYMDNRDVLITLLELLGGKSVSNNVKTETVLSKLQDHITANAKMFVKFAKDPLLLTKVLIKRCVSEKLISKRGDYYYLASDNSPLCDDGGEPTINVAAAYLSNPKRSELKYTLEGKLNS